MRRDDDSIRETTAPAVPLAIDTARDAIVGTRQHLQAPLQFVGEGRVGARMPARATAAWFSASAAERRQSKVRSDPVKMVCKIASP